MFPKEILLKIIHYTHLSWVQDNTKALQTDNEIFETINLEWYMWDHVEHICEKLYGKQLKERTHIISNFEKELFSRMVNKCHIVAEDVIGEDVIGGDVIFELRDKNGDIWKWEWEEKRLERITHCVMGDDWVDPAWFRMYNTRWGSDIEQPVLRFINANEDPIGKMGLFIHSLPPLGHHDKIVYGDFVDELEYEEDFTTKPLVNMSFWA